jgi:hypothetical protein
VLSPNRNKLPQASTNINKQQPSHRIHTCQVNLHACGPVGPLGESQANITPESNVGCATVCQMWMKQQNISGIAFAEAD